MATKLKMRPKVENPNDSVQFLKGIGPQKARALCKLGYETIDDLFYLFPRRYEDRTKLKKIKELTEGETATVKGKIVAAHARYFRGRGHFQIVLKDGTGVVGCTWFNQPYLKQVIKKDSEVFIYGKLGRFGRLQFQNPEYEIADAEDQSPYHSCRITPIYPLVSGLYQRGLRRSLWNLINDHLNRIEEYLPLQVLQDERLTDIKQAFKEIHFPTSHDCFKKAKNRLIFDEFFLFEIRLLKRLYEFKKTKSEFLFDSIEDVTQNFCQTLPFELTASQKKAIQEIKKDLRSRVPMTRLLQGDVGSGKTVVATSFFEASAECGFQAVFLAPTETLAEQHYRTILKHLSPHHRSQLVLLKGSLTEKEKERIRKSLNEGEYLLAVGTHALIQDSINFKNLAFVVIDEQHKFGVEQRSKLLRDSKNKPHVLLMTATPIPRTLAMTLYGDLDVSLINELPSNRKPIKTHWVLKKDEKKVFDSIRKRLAQGEQGYFVYPAIEESDKSSRTALESDFERIKTEFKEFGIAMVHGGMPTDERSKIMQEFMRGSIKALVATTVIEVGIDNPNATFVVIQGAEFFGLSQLHQIRGRVGRGELSSVCFLLGNPGTEEAKKSFQIMSQTQDGFLISEEDLKLRGPGDFLGTRQSGLPLFKLANLITDQKILERARYKAHQVIDSNPDLLGTEYEPLSKKIEQYDKFFGEA